MYGNTWCVLPGVHCPIHATQLNPAPVPTHAQLENGYCVWDFRGQEIEKHIQDRFKQFLWRPRPRTLLSKEQQRQVRKNLREYSRAFEEEDAAEESNVSAELLAQRKRLIDEWNAWRARVKGQKTGQENEEATEEISEWIEEIVEQTEEIVD